MFISSLPLNGKDIFKWAFFIGNAIKLNPNRRLQPRVNQRPNFNYHYHYRYLVLWSSKSDFINKKLINNWNCHWNEMTEKWVILSRINFFEIFESHFRKSLVYSQIWMTVSFLYLIIFNHFIFGPKLLLKITTKWHKSQLNDITPNETKTIHEMDLP